MVKRPKRGATSELDSTEENTFGRQKMLEGWEFAAIKSFAKWVASKKETTPLIAGAIEDWLSVKIQRYYVEMEGDGGKCIENEGES